jgi:signal transduction histidine kinase/DNA-binding response OmpR family regulator
MLRAANSSANMIIGGYYDDYEVVLQQSIGILCESLGTDRSYIWRNHKVDGRLGCYMRSGWGRDTQIYEDLPDAKYLFYDEFLPNWKDMAQDTNVILSDKEDLPNSLIKSDFPGLSKVKSIMAIPLFIHGDFWGFITFDTCEKKRTFTESEAEIMKVGALTIAASITRWEMNIELMKTQKDAMASAKAKSEFLSRMSHEIRTPMNAIIGMTTIAKNSDDDSRIKYCLHKIDASSRQLLSLINDILDMSKIDANKFEIVESEFDFEKMIQDVFNVIQVKLDEKYQRFHVDIEHPFEEYIIGDELRLSQVMINLLNNAVKFTPEKGDIRLKIREEDQEDGKTQLFVSITDTGIGINKEHQEKLFQDFEQIDGGITRSYGGSGLGLAICKKIIDLMGGEIWVESDSGKGTSFSFKVDIKKGREVKPVIPRKMLKEKINVLIIDDSEDVLDYFKNIFRSFSMNCDVALNGNTALHMVKERHKKGEDYNILFIDWNMPDMNGGTVAKRIKELTDNNAIVVMISSSDWSDIHVEAKALGLTNFLPKPVLPSVIYNTVVDLTNSTPMYEEKNQQENEKISWPNKRILIVEDIEINREILLDVIENCQMMADQAENGQIALDMVKENPEKYDLVLMDVQMPIMDGLEATKQIRALDYEATKALPIIAMTANAFKEDEEISLEAGMNGHLAKPLSVDDLYDTLSIYFNN